MKTITISKDQLQAALRDWEQDHRDGKCMSADDTASLTVEQVAAAGAANLWVALGGESEDGYWVAAVLIWVIGAVLSVLITEASK